MPGACPRPVGSESLPQGVDVDKLLDVDKHQALSLRILPNFVERILHRGMLNDCKKDEDVACNNPFV